MSILVLDLDLTAIVCQENIDFLNEDHNILYINTPIRCGNYKYKIGIINPKELTELLETALTKHEGVMILTSGEWIREDIISLLCANLNLSMRAKVKLSQAAFHSPVTDIPLFKNSIPPHENHTHYVKFLSRRERLEKIKQFSPELEGKHLVLFDDSEENYEAVKDLSYVTPIKATTREYEEANKDCYLKAIEALNIAHKKEPNLKRSEVKKTEPVSFISQFFKRLVIKKDEPLTPPKHKQQDIELDTIKLRCGD